jgi:hypothetical protein
MTRLLAGALAALALLSTAADAKTQKQAQARPEVFEALIKCRAVADEAERLRCFDSAAAALETAAERRDLVVVDRQQIRETKKGLFGLDIPNLNPFGSGGDDGEEEIKSIESEVASAYQDGDGRWVVTLKEGGTWAQTDNSPLALRPRVGHKIRIQKAAMGSYMMRVNNQPAVRARRRV